MAEPRGPSCTCGSLAVINAERHANDCHRRMWREAMDRVEALEAENTRLRLLYENAIGNRERFGWTIDHLLECEEALRTVEERAEALEAQRDEALEALDTPAWGEYPAAAEARRILSGED
jgi:hypothetical protein